jgi:uncharacterized protein DUF4296
MKKIALAVVLFVFFSCGNSVVEKPEHLLSKDVMVDILYDLTIIQSAENLDPLPFSQNDIKVNEIIYKKYNTDSVSLAQSNRYYASDPHEYQKMFKRVSEKIEENKKALNEKSIKETGKAIAPSDEPAIQ